MNSGAFFIDIAIRRWQQMGQMRWRGSFGKPMSRSTGRNILNRRFILDLRGSPYVRKNEKTQKIYLVVFSFTFSHSHHYNQNTFGHGVTAVYQSVSI